MASLRSLGQLAPKLCQRNRNYPLNNLIKSVLISTTKKSKDNAVSKTIIEGEMEHIDRDPNEPVEIPKNWVSYGYCRENIVEDNTRMHFVSFLTITVCVVGTTFLLMYMPDNRMKHWIQREAFLELRRREAEGLPLVDRDLVPAHTVELPTDEELGDIEIII